MSAGVPTAGADMLAWAGTVEERWWGDVRGGVHRVCGGHVAASAADGVPALRWLAYRGGPGADGAGEGVRLLAQDQAAGRGARLRHAHAGQHLSGPQAP